jgi:hypothetical protein
VNTDPAVARATVPIVASNRPLSLSGAALVSVIVVATLAALAFWPARAWAPPKRPALSGTIVFDEFVAATGSPPPSADATEHAAP